MKAKKKKKKLKFMDIKYMENDYIRILNVFDRQEQ